MPATSFRRLPLGLLPFVGLCAVALAAPSASGPCPGGYRGPQRNGIYPASDLAARWPDTGPTMLWKRDGNGQGWLSPAVADGKVYVLGSRGGKGYLTCYTLTGERLFQRAFGPAFERRYPGCRSAVEVAEGRAYFASGLGVIYCLDANTGAVIWSIDTVADLGNNPSNWGYNVTPLVVDGKVIFSLSGAEKQTIAVDAATGHEVWAAAPLDYKMGDASPIAVRCEDRTIVIETFQQATVARDARDGKLLWQHTPAGHTQMTPVHADGHLLVREGNGVAMLKLSDDGTAVHRLWSGPRVDDVSQAVILRDTLFVITRPVWRHNRVVVAANGRTFALTGRKRYWFLQAWDVRTGAVLKSERVYSDGSLWAADGMLYVLEGGQGAGPRHARPSTRIWLAQPAATGFVVQSRFSPAQGERQAWANGAIAGGRMFYRHGDVIATYDLRAQGPPTVEGHRTTTVPE